MAQQNPNEKPKKSDVKRNSVVLWRTVLLLVVFGCCIFLPLFWKLWQVQIVDGAKYEEMAIDQQTSDLTVTAPRGTIYDANGNILAISSTVQNVILSPKEILTGAESAKERAERKLELSVGLTDEEKEKKKLNLTGAEQAALGGTYKEFIADGLAPILGIDRADILKRMERTGSMYEVLARRVEEGVSAEVNLFISENKLYPGVYLRPDTKRYYPYSSLASQVIGWVNPNNDNKGAYGLEARYEDVLAGEAGRVVTAKNAAGTEMLSGYENYIDAIAGYNMSLTIDATIQGYCERVLSEGIASYEARYGGFCIAMDPNTGAVLALASSPGYDLNDPWGVSDPVLSAYLEKIEEAVVTTSDVVFYEEGEEPPMVFVSDEAKEAAYLAALEAAQLEQWRSNALSDAYEPGSTFKTLVLAAALEEGVINESNHYYCTGVKKVATWNIHCSNVNGHGDQDLAEAVANSCNPAFIEIGQALGAEKFYDYLEDYGFFEKTGLDPQVEGVSQIWSREEFTSEQGIASLATASFGQTLKITPIQMITAACSTVNGGYLMAPYLVSSITDQNGAVIENTQPTVVRQVVSEQTSQRVRTILEGVVDGGTGKNAYMSGYRIAGKTGTSEKRDEDTRDLIVSFLGIAPADDPKVVILLAFDSPTPAYPGAKVTSSGLFISGGNMAALSTGPLIADILDYMGVAKDYGADSAEDVLVPQTVGLAPLDAQDLLLDRGLGYRLVGEGDKVVDQLPTQGNTVTAGSEVILYLEGERPTEEVTMPNLSGMTTAEATAALANRNLYIRVEGVSGDSTANKATSQSVEAGTLVDPGTVVLVHFMDSQVKDFVTNENIGQNVQ